jgi:uncharacterized protein (DUF433 family)
LTYTGTQAEHPQVQFSRIEINNQALGGVPCVKSAGIPVATVTGLMGQGASSADVLSDYPQLSIEDLFACFAYEAFKR